MLTDKFRGWDQTGSNGANLSFPLAFDIWEADTFPDNDPRGRGGQPNPDAQTNQWLVGVINAGPYIASAFLYVRTDIVRLWWTLICFAAAVGYLIHSTIILGDGVPSSSPLSSAFFRPLGLQFAKIGGNSSLPDCFSVRSKMSRNVTCPPLT